MQDKLSATIESLPVLPTVLVKLFSSSPEQDDYFENIVSLAESDPGLSVKIIKSSNSAASAPVTKIESLPAAVVRLGAKYTVSLITSLMMAKVFSPRSGVELDLWCHALQVAAGARKIVRLSRDATLDPETAYLAGQLHDVGRMVLQMVDEDYLSVIDEADFADPEQLLAAERVRYHDQTHTAVGFQVCRHWQLPETVADAVREHHSWYNNQGGTAPVHKYIAAVVLGDQISLHLLRNNRFQQMEQGEIVNFFSGNSLSGFMKLLGVDASALAGTLTSISEEAENIAGVAGI